MKRNYKSTEKSSYMLFTNNYDINFLNFQFALDNVLTNWAYFEKMDIPKLYSYLEENYKTEIIVESFFNLNRGVEIEEGSFLIDDTVLKIASLETYIQLDRNRKEIFFTFSNNYKQEVLELLKSLKKYILIEEDKRKKLSLIKNERNGFSIEDFELPKNKTILEHNYNNSLIEIDQKITKQLETKNTSGLILLHGKPGTGKTSYIRSLIHKIDKEIIFLPTSYAAKISDPSFVTFLLKHKNSVLIIEDAEQLLVNRDSSRSSAVSALLNVTDGLLGDVLNIQIVCTFNTDLSNIDEALVRKGRLLARYEFEALSVEKSNQLANYLKLDTLFTKPQNLSQIYNYKQENFNHIKQKATIGFN